MKESTIYYLKILLLILIVLFIALFDYISFFEKFYDLDKLNYQSTEDYSIYEAKMTPIKIFFTLTIFISLGSLIYTSLDGYKKRKELKLSIFTTLGICILTIALFIFILLVGILQTVTVI